MTEDKKQKNIAIVGINNQSSELMHALVGNDTVTIAKVLNPEYEDLSELSTLPSLDIVIDTTESKETARQLSELQLTGVDVINHLSARILFVSESKNFSTLRSKRYRNSILESLNEIQRAVNIARNTEELLKMVLNISIHSCLADSGSIMLIDSQRRNLRIEMAQGLDGEIVSTTAQSLGRGVAGTVLRTRNPMLLNGPINVNGLYVHRKRKDIVSSICAPLIVGEEPIGVLNINSKNPERIFDNADMEYLSEITRFISDIIWTSRSYQNSARDAFFFSFINNVHEILDLDFPYPERINLLVMKIANAFSARLCRFYEYREDQKKFQATASNHVDMYLLHGRRVFLNDELTKQILEHPNQIVQSQSISKDGKEVCYLAAPIHQDKQLKELLVVQMPLNSMGFSQEISVLQKISSMIERKEQQLREKKTSHMQNIKFSVISEIAFNIATITNLNKLAKAVMNNACLVLEAESCVLRLAMGSAQHLQLFGVISPSDRHDPALLKKVDRKISTEVVKMRKPLLIKDMRSRPDLGGENQIDSVLCACFLKATRVIGTVTLYDKITVEKRDNHEFSTVDKDIFYHFCLQVSKSLQRFFS